MLAADAPTRVKYMIRRIADTGKVFGLQDGESVSVNICSGARYLALWPHRLYAERLAPTYSEGSTPVEFSMRSLKHFLEGESGIAGVALFPIYTRSGVPMSFEALKEWLQMERDRF